MRNLFLFLAFFVMACTPPAQTPHNRASSDLEQKTVALVEESLFGPHVYCSGVWVSEDQILTANHCLADLDIGERVMYVTRNDVSASDEDEIEALRAGRLQARDEEHDLALVTVKLQPPHAVATVARGDVTVGESTETMGHPMGLWWSYSTGVVSAIRVVSDEDNAMWYVQSTASISPGNSGGGLFNADHEVIGVCHAYFPRGENLNIYVHVQYVRAFLARVHGS